MSIEPLSPPYIGITLAYEDACRLYEHLGTMPHAPGSWSNNTREELAEAIHYERGRL